MKETGDVHARLGGMVDPSERPVLCLGDNKGSNQLTSNEVLHKRSKQFECRARSAAGCARPATPHHTLLHRDQGEHR